MLAEFSVTPIDKGGENLSQYVSQSLQFIEESGLDYKVTAMGTIVEGDADKVFALIQKCHSNMTGQSERVSTYVKIDDRKGAKGRLNGKVKSVEEKLGHELKK